MPDIIIIIIIIIIVISGYKKLLGKKPNRYLT